MRQRNVQAQSPAWREVVAEHEMSDRTVEMIADGRVHFVALKLNCAIRDELFCEAENEAARVRTIRVRRAIDGAEIAGVNRTCSKKQEASDDLAKLFHGNTRRR